MSDIWKVFVYKTCYNKWILEKDSVVNEYEEFDKKRLVTKFNTFEEFPLEIQEKLAVLMLVPRGVTVPTIGYRSKYYDNSYFLNE